MEKSGVGLEEGKYIEPRNFTSSDEEAANSGTSSSWNSRWSDTAVSKTEESTKIRVKYGNISSIPRTHRGDAVEGVSNEGELFEILAVGDPDSGISTLSTTTTGVPVHF